MTTYSPITKEKIKTHFQYSWWKYLLLVVLTLLLWNLLFTTTQYRSPEHLKVEFYVDAIETVETTANMEALLEDIHARVMPEMEEVTYTVLGLDETYGSMQLTVWVSAGQGDVYLLMKDRFLSLARNGGLVDLQPYIDNGTLPVEGFALSKGQVANEYAGAKAQYGIPTDGLTGLSACGAVTEGSFLCMLAGNGNEEYAALFMRELLLQGQPQ